jgi:Chaperone of endosialidase
MGLESTTFIDGLVATNPTSSDNANQGDNHIRLIKSALKATFPAVTGAVTATHTQLNSVTSKLDLSGGTMTGALTVLTPTATGHAATKGYVDTGLAGKANTSHTHVIADVTGLQTALDTRLRFDTSTQGLTETEKTNARTNLGITSTGTAQNTDQIPEGTTNLYFTTARARSSFSAGTGISISGGVISSTVSAPVTSVAGKTGAVTLVTSDISGLDTALAGKANTSSLSNYLPLSGGTLSGGLTISAGNLTLSSGNVSVTGTITASGDITAFSDARLKVNVNTIENALHTVKSLRGVTYVSKLTAEEHVGVIAQEVERVLPQVVKTHSDSLKSVAYGNLVGLLIEAIKELEARVAELENR